MPKIILETHINTCIERVFDLSRSIDLHKLSTKKTNEEAISGKTTGLLELGESVTWKAKHLGFYQKLSSKITEFEKPNYFVDEQVKGIFNSLYHKHEFQKLADNSTLMIDTFIYRSPFGILGRIVDALFLKSYLTKFLIQRNNCIKKVAENETWKELIN